VQLSKHSVKSWGSKVAAGGAGALQKFAAAFEAALAGFLEIVNTASGADMFRRLETRLNEVRHCAEILYF
jgi:hypothetical protein